jgi:tyrosinase
MIDSVVSRVGGWVMPALLLAAVTSAAFLSGCGGGGDAATSTPPSEPIDPEPTASATFVRRDINSYPADSAFIASFREGVATMMGRDATDPTSWAYQANIHGFPTSSSGSNCSPNNSGPSQPAWATCQHGSYFFLAWHRMYLYYFERILRSASGDPAFTLPFWDYEQAAQRPLPLAFREPADAGNALFVAERNTTPGLDMNAGDPLPESDTDASLALSRIPFDTASRPQSASTFGGWQIANPMHFASGYGGLERLPHNAIHNDVGGPTGWMADPDCAARDPIFWLHHANIDRLWQAWLNEGGGRMNPTMDPTWLTTQFTFFDENGQEVALSGSQILDTALQLDYVYDGVPMMALQVTSAGAAVATPPEGASQAAEVTMLGSSAGGRIALGNSARSVSMTVSPAAHQRMTAMLAETTEEHPIILALEQVRQERRGVNYEVYLNLPEGTEPDPDGPYYVGHLSLFSGHEGDGPQNYELDATEVVRGLRERNEWTSGDARVSFVRSGGAVEQMPEGETHISFARAMLHE